MRAALKAPASNVVALRPPHRDPIFALIERWEAAEIAYLAKLREQSELEQKIWNEERARGRNGSDITHEAAYLSINHQRLYTKADIVAYVETERGPLEKLFSGVTTAEKQIRKAKAERIKVLCDDLHREQRELARIQRANGWAAMVKQTDALGDAEANALRNLCGTKPTTIAGLAAMLAALQLKMEEGAYRTAYADGRTAKLHATLVSASKALAKAASK